MSATPLKFALISTLALLLMAGQLFAASVDSEAEVEEGEVPLSNDDICDVAGDKGCRVYCIANGYPNGGQCSPVMNKCRCDNRSVEREPVCVVGGEVACKMQCIASGHDNGGHCTLNNNCVCHL